MKRQQQSLSWVLLASLVVLTAGGLPVGAQYAGGTGTADDPYLIETAAQMNAIGLYPEDWNKHFRLTANIDMNDLDGASMNLIGSFGGVFDGGGHAIANLTHLATDEEGAPEWPDVMFIGLFRAIGGRDALVKDLGLVNPDVRPGPTCTKEVYAVGALAGMVSQGWVRNCYVEGGRVAGSRYVGGLVGQCRDDAAVSDSWSSAEVSGDNVVGGLAGGDYGPASIWLCHAQGRVSGRVNVGGLVGGWSHDCILDECFTTGTVTATQQAGGLVGNLGGSVSNCYSTAQVSGDFILGGLVGINSRLISASWAGGDVIGGQTVGGLVGLNLVGDGYFVPYYDTTVADCYAAGAVSGGNVVGGLIGSNEGRVLRCYSRGVVGGSPTHGIVGGLVAGDGGVPEWDVRDSFWDRTTSGVDVSKGGTGKTTAEMEDLGTYLAVGWDFVGETVNGADDLWKMSGAEPNYPKLAWEEEPADDPVDPNGVNGAQSRMPARDGM